MLAKYTKCLRRILITFLLTSLLSNYGVAAAVLRSKVDLSNYPELAEFSDNVFRIVGDISPGTFEEFDLKYSAIAAPGDLNLLFLDSLGGSIKEASKIANYVSENGITTVIGPGAQCLSACAFIFMAGRTPEYEGPGSTSRYLHLRGRLGFHAPYLPFDQSKLNEKFEGTYKDVFDAYNAATRQIGQLLGSSNSTGIQWPPSLVGEALLTEPDKFRIVETIDDAGRWSISLFGFKERKTKLNGTDRYIACVNFHRWSSDDSWYEYQGWGFMDEEPVTAAISTQKREKNKKGFQDIHSIMLDQMNAVTCHFYRENKQGEIMMSYDTDSVEPGFVVEESSKYDPRTKLVDVEALN